MIDMTRWRGTPVRAVRRSGVAVLSAAALAQRLWHAHRLGLRDGSAPNRVNSRQSLSTGARFVDVDDLINSAEVTDLRLCPK
jgi:hypothetical protein